MALNEEIADLLENGTLSQNVRANAELLHGVLSYIAEEDNLHSLQFSGVADGLMRRWAVRKGTNN